MGDLRGKKLGTILVTLGVLDPDQEAAALESSKKWNVRFGEACVRMGFVAEDIVVRGLAMQMGAPSVTLSRITIREEVRCAIDPAIAEKHRVIPVQILDADLRGRRTLVLAMAAPKEQPVLDEIAFATSFRIHPVIASEREIEHSLLELYGIHLHAMRNRDLVDLAFGEDDEPMEIDR